MPEKGCRLDRGGTEACGGGFEVLGLFWGVSLFIGFFSVGIKSYGATWVPRGTRACLGGMACPGASWALGGPPPAVFDANIFYIFNKKSPKSFIQFQEL